MITVIGALDLVITLRASIAHLSGVRGRFTWARLDTNPHRVRPRYWRDGLFHPGASLYRRRTFADSRPVLDEVVADLHDPVGNGASPPR